LSAPAHIKQWEQEEVVRSASEAQKTDLDSLKYAEGDLDRFVDPPHDTIFPLEYCYYLLGNVEDKRVVDFGCGQGENTVPLVRRQAKVFGVDISPDAITVALERLEVNGHPDKAEFVVASAHSLPIAGDSIDVVFGIAILHHLDLNQVSREVRRVLRKGGRAIFQEPVRDSRMLTAFRKLVPYKSVDVSPHERPLTQTELKNFAEGFRHFHTKSFWLPYMNPLLESGLFSRGVLIALLKFDYFVLTIFPFLEHFATHRVFMVTK